MLPSKQFEIALTVALYTEWQSVLTRPEHLPPGANAEAAIGLLRYLASIAHLQEVHFLWRPFLRDPDDDMVLECAVASVRRPNSAHHKVWELALRDEISVNHFNAAAPLVKSASARTATWWLHDQQRQRNCQGPC
jgi:hypothetical protein